MMFAGGMKVPPMVKQQSCFCRCLSSWMNRMAVSVCEVRHMAVAGLQPGLCTTPAPIYLLLSHILQNLSSRLAET